MASRNDEAFFCDVGRDARKRWGKGRRQSNVYKFFEHPACGGRGPGVRRNQAEKLRLVGGIDPRDRKSKDAAEMPCRNLRSDLIS